MAKPAAASYTTPRAVRGDGRPTAARWPRRLAGALLLPREHGAWAMLLMPCLVGTAAAGWGGWPSLLLLTSVLLLFSSSRSLELLLQHRPFSPSSTTGAGQRAALTADPASRIEAASGWRQALLRLALYLGVGGTAGAILLLLYHRWALLAIGGLALAVLAGQMLLRGRRLDRFWAVRLLSIAALSATGPAAYYTATGVLDRHALAIWILVFLYLGSSVFYVRLFYPASTRQSNWAARHVRLRAERHMLGYLAATLLSVVTFAAAGLLPYLAPAAFVPLVGKVAWARFRRGDRPSLKRIGLMEIGHTMLFALLAVAALAVW